MKPIKGGGAGLLLERKVDTGASEIWKITERLAKDFDARAPTWVFLTSGTSFGYGITTTEDLEHEMLVMPIFLSKFCSDQEFEAFAALALVSHDADNDEGFFARDRMLAAKLGDSITAHSILKREVYGAIWNGTLKDCDEMVLRGERTDLPLKAFAKVIQELSLEAVLFKLNTENQLVQLSEFSYSPSNAGI